MYVNVCMYVYLCMYVCMCMYVSMYLCIYVSMYLCIYVGMYMFVCIKHTHSFFFMMRLCLFPECVARVPVSLWGSGG